MTGSGYMIKPTSYSFLLVFMILIITGCSSTKSTPVIPENPQADINLPANELSTSESSRSILGAWTLSINHETLEATVTPNRSLDRHYNVKYLIPTPEVVINTIYPNYVIDADVTLTNPYTFPAYDVRLIIFTDEYGHFLDNADVWTDLYDIPAGQDINPFKAYAKDRPNRIFEGETQHTENLLVFAPPPGHPIQFAIDASYPGNCEEPYAFENFQQDVLHPHVGANATVTIDVLDWQNNVSEVYLQCPEITNEPETAFEYVSSNRWRLNLVNNAGAPIGTYTAYLLSRSSNSGGLALYDKILITVSSGIGIPSDPQKVGRITMLDRCENVNVRNNLACTFSRSSLIIIDVSNPLDPDIVSASFVGVDGSVANVYFLNDLLLIFSGAKYVLLNISDPKNPLILYEEVNEKGFREATLRDNILYAEGYVSGSGYELTIYDFTDLYNPVELGSIVIGENIKEIELKDDYVYLTTETYSVHSLDVVDISDLSNPQLVASLDFSGGSLDFEIRDNFIYLATSKLTVIDISNPLIPEIISEMYIQGYSYFKVYENYLYTCTSYLSYPNYFSVYSLDDPEFPVILASIEMLEPQGFDVFGNHAYVADYEEGLKVVDISVPANPQIVSNLPSIYMVRDIAVNNGYAYVATWGYTGYSCGMQIYDISDPANPDFLSSSIDFYSNNIEVYDEYVFILGSFSSDHKLLSVNVQDPISPQVVSQSSASHWPRDLAFEGDMAIAACSYYIDTFSYPGAIYRYDVSDPTNIQRTGSIISNPFDLRSVAVSGDYAYVSRFVSNGSGECDLLVIDISDPGTIDIATTNDSISWMNLATQGNYLYNVYTEFSVVDITDPVNPQIIASLDSLYNGMDIVASGNYAYIPIYDFQHAHYLAVVDISDPANPYIFRTLDLPDAPESLKKYENYLYIIEGVMGRFNPAIDIIKLW
jgi:hypothetical protein